MYNDGCNGGLMDYAFQFIISNGGIDNETHYPYKGIDYNCDLVRKNAKVFNIDDYEDVPPNEKSLQKAVAHQPICVAIEASGRAFQHYSSGIFSGRCGTQLDHGVAVVGYGTEKWSRLLDSEELMGLQLGQSRVISLSHGCSAKCGIAMEASYPIKNARNKIIAGEEGIINSV
ncbi:Cysteine proteinase COT44 [Capsicum annuum]|nr:Cysteine proteinase COT44 [Capsicum annuum]KAF3657511.1 Cysteine proteinase COT44 [Capsicum annuum]